MGQLLILYACLLLERIEMRMLKWMMEINRQSLSSKGVARIKDANPIG